jgi:PAS domain S-box-containing protein
LVSEPSTHRPELLAPSGDWDALREQRDWLRATLASIADALIATDTGGRVLFLNPVARALTGWAEDEAAGRPLADVFPIRNEGAHQPAEDPVGRVLREGAVVGLAGRTVLVARDGTERPVGGSAAPIRDADGAPTGAVLVFRDVTEQKRAAEALRVSEERFARFMQHLPGLAWIKDVQGRYVYANDAAVNAFRTPRADLYGRTDDEVFPPETAAQFRANDLRALSGGAGVQVVETLKHEDGVVHHSLVSKFPIPGPDGAVALVGGMAIDITEQKRTQAVLEESEQRFRQLADAMPQIVWAAGPDGYLDYYNRRWYEFTGFPEGQGGDESWKPILHPEDLQKCVDTWYGAVRSGRAYQIEYRFWDRKTGTYRWHLGRALPVRDQHGDVVRWFGSCTDIDDQKRAQEALAEADRRKDEFLAMLAHELRNPLAPIRNAAQVLNLLGPADANLQWARDVIERQVRHLARLVDDLLDVSRITRGKIALHKEAVELAVVVARAVETARPLIDARRQELTVTLPPGPVRVEADPTRLAQVVSNLLNNASKFTEEGGHVRLAVERSGGEVRVSVRDSGIGIPADLLPQVFDLFTQGDRSLARSEGGLGIGLTVVKSLVEMQGGRVSVSSAGPGQGSEFVVRLPALEPAPSPTAEGGETGPPPGPASPRRVLVVDDNEDAAESLALLLRVAGHEARTAYDGPTALTAVDAFRPEVVILDIGLPRMDGYEVARRLRERAAGPRPLLVTLTDYGQEDDRRRAGEAGFDAHLVKPADLAALHRLFAEPGPPA